MDTSRGKGISFTCGHGDFELREDLLCWYETDMVDDRGHEDTGKWAAVAMPFATGSNG